jgi:hypothetical protein
MENKSAQTGRLENGACRKEDGSGLLEGVKILEYWKEQWNK